MENACWEGAFWQKCQMEWARQVVDRFSWKEWDCAEKKEIGYGMFHRYEMFHRYGMFHMRKDCPA